MSDHGILFVLTSMLLLGMRHGIDHDHLAAITDIAALQHKRGRAMRLGLVYATGHAIVLCVLGTTAVLIGLRLPEGWEVWRERAVGATLIALGVSVAAGLIAGLRNRDDNGHDFQFVSRGGMIVVFVKRVTSWLRRVYGAGPAPARTGHAETPAFLLGVLHGLGAETPTQVMLLVLAAGMGASAGVASVGAFIGGLFLTNTILCAVMSGLFARRSLHRRFIFTLSGASALYSVTVGVFYLLQWST